MSLHAKERPPVFFIVSGVAKSTQEHEINTKEKDLPPSVRLIIARLHLKISEHFKGKPRGKPVRLNLKKMSKQEDDESETHYRGTAVVTVRDPKKTNTFDLDYAIAVLQDKVTEAYARGKFPDGKTRTFDLINGTETIEP